MDSSDQKFFEELAGVTKENEGVDTEAVSETPEVELVKTGTALPPRAKAASLREEKKLKSDGGPEGQLTIDVYQTPTEIVVESAIAGVRPEDLDVTVSGDSVSIRGERHHENEVREEDYFYQECYWGRFSRSIILPEEVDAERASVKFKNGILSVHLPKRNREKGRKLKIGVE